MLRSICEVYHPLMKIFSLSSQKKSRTRILDGSRFQFLDLVTNILLLTKVTRVTNILSRTTVTMVNSTLLQAKVTKVIDFLLLTKVTLVTNIFLLTKVTMVTNILLLTTVTMVTSTLLQAKVKTATSGSKERVTTGMKESSFLLTKKKSCNCKC